MLVTAFLFGSEFRVYGANSSISLSFSEVVNQINMTRIKDDVRVFSSFSSRFTGYPGCDEAAEFIYNRFIELGLENVSYESFSVAVPFDYGANITIASDGEVIPAHTLAPNLVETCALPPEGLTAPLIYVGDGDLSDYDGKRINGSIVLMDFNCRDKWLYAVMFGAKAIIFIGKEATRYDASLKTLNIPLDFPRLYISEGDGEKLKELIRSSSNGEIQVNIKSFMVYKNVEAKNVLGVIKGKTLSDEYVVITAHYDSRSIVPAVSPGAEEAIGIAALLELARFYAKPENRPERSVIFLALSGYGQGLAGAREYVHTHLSEVGGKLRLFISLELNSGSKTSGILYWGGFYEYLKPIARYVGSNRIKYRIRDYISEIESQTGLESFVIDLITQSNTEIFNNIPTYPFYLNSEPFTLAGGLGISFFTTNSYNPFEGTPFDRYEKINFKNLEAQIQPIFYIIHRILNDETLVLQELKPTIGASTGGWVDLTGDVVKYNPEVGWYDPIPNATVVVTQNLPAGARGQLFAIVIADENGRYEIHGLQQRNSPMSSNPVSYTVRAYLDKPTFNPIEYAPDFGKYGAVYPSTDFTIEKSVKFVRTVVFKCASFALIGIFDPNKPSTMFQDVRVEVRIFRSDSVPDFFGVVAGANNIMGYAMVFVRPRDKIEIILKSGVERDPFAVIINGSDEKPSGYGLHPIEGTTVIINSFDILRDLYLIDEYRLSNAKTFVTQSIHEETEIRIRKAYEALRNYNYSIFYVEILEGWSRERMAYLEIKGFLMDVISTGTLYLLLLIPFLFLSERFFGETTVTRRLLRIAIMFALFIAIFYFLHPGLRLASNLLMVISGFFLAILLVPGFLIVASNDIKIFKKARETLLGAHFRETSRGGLLLTTFSIGIGNLKKRKMRFALTLATIVILVFALVALTAVSSLKLSKPYTFAGKTIYNGILVRSANPTNPLQSMITTRIIDYFKIKYSGSGAISARAYLYPPGSAEQLRIEGDNGKAGTVRAVVGLSATEPKVSMLDASLINGSWFVRDYEKTCLLPQNLASKLNVKVGDEILFEGVLLKVRGIFDPVAYSAFLDLDQNIISPVVGGSQRGVIFRVSPSSLLIIPYGLARSLGAGSYSIALRFNNESNIISSARALADTFPGLFMRVGVNGTIISFFSGEVTYFSGWQMLIVLLAIAAFSMTNVLVGSIYERTREISILATLGLSPMHISLMFISESSIYAVLGSLLGYVLGLFTNGLIREFNLLPATETLNIASSWILTSIAVSIAATFLATLYPALKVHRLVTPSLERAWKIPTKPKGDEWEIPLPYMIQEREVMGVLAFMYEFFEAHRTEESGSFWVRDLRVTEHKEAGVSAKSLEMIARIVPYEANIEQKCRLMFIGKVGSDKYSVILHITRIFGILTTWKHSNRNFIDHIRKQLLTWRSLPPNQRERYIKSASDLLKEATKVI